MMTKIDEKNEKECPFCAEMIKVRAKKCKHCGEFLHGSRGEFLRELLGDDIDIGSITDAKGVAVGKGSQAGIVSDGSTLLQSQGNISLGKTRRDEQYDIALNWNGRRTMRRFDLSERDLSQASLPKADIRRANLSKAILVYANLANTNLSNADLSYANLSNVNLEGANLENADLRFSNLSGARLSGANLEHANLIHVTLVNASLTRANLNYTDLDSADLSNADLCNATLNYTDLSNANLSGALLIPGPNYYFNGDRHTRCTPPSSEAASLKRATENALLTNAIMPDGKKYDESWPKRQAYNR